MNNILKTKQTTLYCYNKKTNIINLNIHNKKEDGLEKQVSKLVMSIKQKKMKELFGIDGPGNTDTGIRKWK